jgi:hypothetical protein
MFDLCRMSTSNFYESFYLDLTSKYNFYSKTNQTHNISNSFHFGTTLYMFRTVSPSIIRSLRLYIQHHIPFPLASSHRTCM